MAEAPAADPGAARSGSRAGRWIAVLGSVLRAALAASLVWICWQDLPASAARAEFAALPPFDYWKEAETLLEQERFSEAQLMVDAGLEARPDQRASFEALRQRIEVERRSWMHRFQQLGQGALKGTGRSLEALTGAVVADLFVFGDVRDLVVQSGRRLRGEQTDPVIVALSAGGLLFTVYPAADLGVALLKFARRIGALSQAFAKSLMGTVEQAVRTRKAGPVQAVSADVSTLSRQARPSGAVHILRGVDAVDELALAARFSERPGGAFALWLSGREGVAWLKSGARGGDELLLQAARRGRAGLEYLGRRSGLMLRPHPLLGLIKGLWKGNVPDLLLQLAEQYATVLLALACAWLSFEVLLLLWRLLGV